MFKKIRLKIAFKFTALVFILLLMSGGIFIGVEYISARQKTDSRLERDAARIVNEIHAPLESMRDVLKGRDRSRIRVLDFDGKTIFAGDLFAEVQVSTSTKKFSATRSQDEAYRIFTTQILEGGKLIGFFQLAEKEKIKFGDLPEKGMLFVLVSIIISLVTFVFGLSFAKQSLAPAEEMFERLEQFVQDASHELRTPLAVLNSSLDLALKTKQYREGILSAKKDLASASLLVERLLELARLDKFTIQLKSVDLSTLVLGIIEQYSILARGKNLTITSTVEKDIAVEGDDSLLKQLFGNLIDNAIKFTPLGGKIEAELKNNVFRIHDTGIGIKSEMLSHIFDRFYQGDLSRSKEGFGLGLAIVKKIVELHDWKIVAVSEEGKGATFTITFQNKSS